jgi:hypothetical protein
MSFALKVHRPPRRGSSVMVETSKHSRNLTGVMGYKNPKPVNMEDGMSYCLSKRIPARWMMSKTILSEWLYRYTIIEKTNDVVSFKT